MTSAASKVLVVEDEHAIAVALRDDLTAHGYEVEIASDGLAGERAACDGAFDLILLDLMLPRKDGFGVCRSLRAAGVKTPTAAARPCPFPPCRLPPTEVRPLPRVGHALTCTSARTSAELALRS